MYTVSTCLHLFIVIFQSILHRPNCFECLKLVVSNDLCGTYSYFGTS
uniref:Uncharacterized protein n=1 Tax=Lepeophtheirus salmonis TaxID=72036 RepID=A0A0K2TPX2_LEPSM